MSSKCVLEFTVSEIALTGATTPQEVVRRLRAAGIKRVSLTAPRDDRAGIMEDHRASVRAYEKRKAAIEKMNAKRAEKSAPPVPFVEVEPKPPAAKPQKYVLAIKDDDVTREHVLAALKAASPLVPITLSVTEVDARKGADVLITGESGALVKLRWRGVLPISAASVALDGSGKGRIQFGASAGVLACEPVPVDFTYDGESMGAARLLVNFG